MKPKKVKNIQMDRKQSIYNKNGNLDGKRALVIPLERSKESEEIKASAECMK